MWPIPATFQVELEYVEGSTLITFYLGSSILKAQAYGMSVEAHVEAHIVAVVCPTAD